VGGDKIIDYTYAILENKTGKNYQPHPIGFSSLFTNSTQYE